MQHLPREKYETDDKFSAPVIRVTFFLRQFFSNTFDLQSSIIPFTTKNLFIIKKIDRLNCISVCVSVSSLVCCSKILLVTIEKLRNLLDGTKACFFKSIIREYIHLSWEIISLVKKKIAYFSKLFTKKMLYWKKKSFLLLSQVEISTVITSMRNITSCFMISSWIGDRFVLSVHDVI